MLLKVKLGNKTTMKEKINRIPSIIPPLSHFFQRSVRSVRCGGQKQNKPTQRWIKGEGVCRKTVPLLFFRDCLKFITNFINSFDLLESIPRGIGSTTLGLRIAWYSGGCQKLIGPLCRNDFYWTKMIQVPPSYWQ